MNKNTVEENLLCIVTGIIMAIVILAMICGDGDKGLIDLF